MGYPSTLHIDAQALRCVITDRQAHVSICPCVSAYLRSLAEVVGHCPDECTHADCDLVRFVLHVHNSIASTLN